MNKTHLIYIGIGVAVLLALYFAFSCKGCRSAAITPKMTQTDRPGDVTDLTRDEREL